MKCPYCNNEMVAGFVQSSRDILFGEDKHTLSIKARGKDIRLAKGWDGCFIEANCCSNCQKIIIDYNSHK